MKKTLIKLGVTLLIFIISLCVTSAILNRGSSDLTAEMGKASLPVIYMNVNDEYVNPLHGYTMEMEGNYLRGTITPLMANRSLSFRVNLYDAVIAKMGFEVRSMDMGRLVEDTAIEDFTYDESGSMYATITLKDLIEDDEEYMLIIKLTTSSGDVIRYYARVINRAELYLTEKMDFVRDFSDRTFDRAAAEEIKMYMESNSEGDNSSFAYVNIHSSFNQLTWGNLLPQVTTDKTLEILDIDGPNASMRLTYQVMARNNLHNVVEYFRLRRGNDRMYLMEYERTMNQVVGEASDTVVNGKIIHGIVNGEITSLENETGEVYAFAQEGELYSYDMTSGTLAKIYSFTDAENNDERTRYQQFSIKPIYIDEPGNIKFLVYGYMNRGRHEGQVGIAFYEYDCALNAIEEKFFMPYPKSPSILSKDLGILSYINPRGDFYALIDGTVYLINPEMRRIQVIQDSISEARFVSSTDQSMIAIQPGVEIKQYKEIDLYSLDRESPTIIDAPDGCIVMPIGFMDKDLVYGVARRDDITTDEAGRALVPMFSIRIQSINGTLLKEYSQPGVYTLDARIVDNMIKLERVTRDEITGKFVETVGDHIMSNAVEQTKRNVCTTIVAEETETTYQTVLYKETDVSLKETNPKEIIFVENRNILLEHPDTLTRFYSYVRGELISINTDAADAVTEAYENNGVVVDKDCDYIWEFGNRKNSNLVEVELPTITVQSDGEQTADEGADNEADDSAEAGEEQVLDTSTMSSYALCLDMMLKSDDVYKNTAELLRTESVINVLKNNLDKTVLDLSGCDFEAMLYYVSQDTPVMVITGGGQAVVLLGYDSKNVTVYDPIVGKTRKMGMQEASRTFSEAGNQYITYVK